MAKMSDGVTFGRITGVVHSGDGVVIQVDEELALGLAKKDEYLIGCIGLKRFIARLGGGDGTVGSLIKGSNEVSQLVLFDPHLRRQELVDLWKENQYVSIVYPKRMLEIISVYLACQLLEPGFWMRCPYGSHDRPGSHIETHVLLYLCQ